MESICQFDFFRLIVDANGVLQSKDELEALKQRAQAVNATDAIFIAHGFRNNEDDATGLYTRFLCNFRQHVDGVFHDNLGARRYVVAGVYWPSKSFQEVEEFTGSVQSAGDDDSADKEAVRVALQEMKQDLAEGDEKDKLDRALVLLESVKDRRDAQDEFVRQVRSLIQNPGADPMEGAERICSTPGSELLDKLALPIRLPTKRAPQSDDEGGTEGVDDMNFGEVDSGDTQGIVTTVFGSIFGRIGQFLNLTTWYIMKDRSGTVGSNGVAAAIRDFHAARPSTRIHLVGHSLGGRLMAACSKSLAQDAKDSQVRPDSLTLLEAAFSHYGFSKDNGNGQPGFFRVVMDGPIVKGPIMATFSMKDTVVGKVYAIASRLADDNVKAIGDANDPYGGIGRNGAQKTEEAVFDSLKAPGTEPRQFTIGKVTCLDGSQNLINDHSDITNLAVTFAFASAVQQT